MAILDCLKIINRYRRGRRGMFGQVLKALYELLPIRAVRELVAVIIRKVVKLLDTLHECATIFDCAIWDLTLYDWGGLCSEQLRTLRDYLRTLRFDDWGGEDCAQF